MKRKVELLLAKEMENPGGSSWKARHGMKEVTRLCGFVSDSESLRNRIKPMCRSMIRKPWSWF